MTRVLNRKDSKHAKQFNFQFHSAVVTCHITHALLTPLNHGNSQPTVYLFFYTVNVCKHCKLIRFIGLMQWSNPSICLFGLLLIPLSN